MVEYGVRGVQASDEREGGMTPKAYRRLVSPSGYIVEDRPEGLYLLGDYAEAMGMALAYVAVRVEETADGWTVELGYSHDPSDGWADWGTGADLATAWRYALGSHFGSTEDAELIEGRVE